jgi:LrgB-like family
VTGIVVTRLMKRFRLRDFRALGFAVGLGSHGIGTARAFQVDQVAGTGIAMGLNALLATILVPSRSRCPSGEGAHQCLARACARRVTLFTGPPRPPTVVCSDRAIVTIVRGRGACPRGGQPRHLSSLSEAGRILFRRSAAAVIAFGCRLLLSMLSTPSGPRCQRSKGTMQPSGAPTSWPSSGAGE